MLIGKPLTIAFAVSISLTAQERPASPAAPASPPQPSMAATTLPEFISLRQQNEMLEKKIKALAEQQREKPAQPDPLAAQSEMLEQYMRLLRQQQTVLKTPAYAVNTPSHFKEGGTVREDILIENVQKAYTALIGVAPEVAKELDCAQKTVVLYGPAQSEELLSVKVFNDQIEQLESRLKSILTIDAPLAPDKPGAGTSVYSVSALSGPVLRSVLDLISFFHANSAPRMEDTGVDEKALVAIIASAATSEGCRVYMPDQFVANPFNANSQVMAKLQGLADLSDNGGAQGKTPGLQQRVRDLKLELKRSETMSESLKDKIEVERKKLDVAVDRVDFLKGRVDWISSHIKDERNASLQQKLNQTFEKSWNDLEAAIRRQLASNLPQTMEDQNRTNESVKRLDLLKSRTDWLAQYVKDEKDLAVQDKMKSVLSKNWDELEVAVKALEGEVTSVPKATEANERERQRWDNHSAEVKELIATSMAAQEAYIAFRGALLDGSSGVSPLSRMLRAEALRDLTFDEKFQERAGATIVQLTLQKLAGTYVTGEQREDFSGGVALSYMQYEPNGRVKKSGVHTVYSGFKSKL